MNRREEVVPRGRRRAPREYGSVYGGVASEPVEVKRTTAMRLRGCVLGVAVATMFVVLPNLGRPVVAGEATDQIRTRGRSTRVLKPPSGRALSCAARVVT